MACVRPDKPSKRTRNAFSFPIFTVLWVTLSSFSSFRLALLFNPLDDIGVQFTFGLEIFEPDHRTPPHVHEQAHELFFILSGTGEAFCDGQRINISAGDAVVFPPTSGGSSASVHDAELSLQHSMCCACFHHCR